MNIKDVPLRNFCVQAYNEHAAGMQQDTARRLLPQALLPIWDMELTVQEVIRCHDHCGLTGLGGLPQTIQRKILYERAARVYQLTT